MSAPGTPPTVPSEKGTGRDSTSTFPLLLLLLRGRGEWVMGDGPQKAASPQNLDTSWPVYPSHLTARLGFVVAGDDALPRFRVSTGVRSCPIITIHSVTIANSLAG
jgi:hypothetical protein